MNVDGLVAAGLVAFGVSFFAGMQTAPDAPPASSTRTIANAERLDLGLAAALPDRAASRTAEATPEPARKPKKASKPKRKAAPKATPRPAAPVVVQRPAPAPAAPAPAPASTPAPTATPTPQQFDDGGEPTSGNFDDSGTTP